MNREVVVGVAGSEECSSSISLSFSSLFHSLPGANELLMAVETGAMDQSSISLSLSLSLCVPLSLPPPTCPPLLHSLLLAFWQPPSPRWLPLTSFIVCQQISGDGAGGSVRKLFGPQPLPPLFLSVHFFFLSFLFSAPSFLLP